MNKYFIITIIILSTLIFGCSDQPKTTIVQDKTYSCPESSTTQGEVLYEDTLSTTLAYQDPVVYFVPKESNLKTIEVDSLKTNGDYSDPFELVCRKSGVEYQPIAVTEQDGAHSVVGKSFVAEGSEMVFELEGKSFAPIQTRVQNRLSKQYYTITGCGSATNHWYELQDSACVVDDNTKTGNTLDLQEDGEIDINIRVQTIENKKQFGEDDLNTFMLVDADNGQWQEPEVMLTGQKLSSNKNLLSDDDKLYLSDYEYVYKIKPIDGREQIINLFIRAKDGIEPTQDPIIEFCSEGRYRSNKVRNAIKVGCVSDGSPREMVSSSKRQRLEININ